MALRLLSFLGFAPRRPVWRSGAGDPVLALTEDGAIRSASAGAEALIAAEGGLAGRALADFVSREDRVALKAALRRAAAAEREAPAERVFVRLQRPAGAQGPAAFAEISLIRRGGGLAALIRDRAAELALARRDRAEAPETAEAKGVSPELLADLGHELKTPLNAILGFADAMETETFGPLGHDKYREYAGHIRASGGHLADLIAAILDRAKLDAGRYRLTPALAEPGPLAKSCAEMIRGEAEKAGLSLRVEIADDLPETMLDARAVRQILINLLSNAVKFTAAGEVALTVSAKDGVLRFVVADTGVGMSQMALARLGERFTGLHKSGVRGAPGSGLGLSLAFSLAKLHGGALEISSAPGEGAVATLSLPVRRTLAEMAGEGLSVDGDIKSQLDRVAAFRRERAKSPRADGRSAA
jgi:two-component system, cell cycle sensor histidine kinase DivJ